MKKIINLIVFVNVFLGNLHSQDTLKNVLVKDIQPFLSSSFLDNSSFPQRFFILNNKLIFEAFSKYGKDFWVSDGTDMGTKRLKEINPSFPQYIGGLTIFGDKILFTADDNIHGSEPWIADLTFNNAKMIKDIKPDNPNIPGDNGSSGTGNFIIFKNKAYFAATPTGSNQLFVTDGTNEGTVMLTKIGIGDRNPSGFIEFNNKLFFSCKSNQYDSHLWVTDGTPDSTVELEVFRNGLNYNLFNFSPIVYKNKLFFL